MQHGPKNSQIKSWKIRNEIINCMADCVTKEIIKEIQDFKNYTIIAAEVTDRYPNKKILLDSHGIMIEDCRGQA